MAEPVVSPERLAAGRAFLDRQGLNLFACLVTADLPPPVRAFWERAGETGRYTRLVLLGHGGRRLWQVLHQINPGLSGPDPIDRFSQAQVARFVTDYLDGADYRLLYPGDTPVPLGRLGELAGWCRPSPLGLGIHPTFGLWFAYRAAFLIAAPLPSVVTSPEPVPCATCHDRPCIAACPAGAVFAPAGFDVAACSTFRLQPASPCAGRCLARLACPAAPEHRYGDDQIAYHYGHSLATIRTYYQTRE